MTVKAQVSLVEMNSGDDVAANLHAAAAAVADAAAAGARLVVLPENFAFLGADAQAKFAVAEDAGDGPIQRWLADTAAASGVWLVGGTIPLHGDDGARVRAACLVYDDTGHCRARYDKIHLFDVDLGAGEGYRESATFEPGDRPAWVDTPLGRLGLAVCYDVRFPELFRWLADAGCELVALPSAFTVPTGQAHWTVLVRARAIENGMWLLAPGQVGSHPGGRRTWGHSLVVDPWGVVLAEGEGPGAVTAAFDPDAVAAARRRIPALEHRRPAAYAAGRC
ncbi:carbon-nitrogen hydrolase family protein [Arhodomonas aquaeolei]|uniref:carbon-nitrogen hydrolase family protein n=1 Tax=Arhodomonas aquaeolei TaxID=2369 RepID=UPI00039DDFA0|nr:carbon-nitrogen hydrolase family protein [Arhodomonas aquaeolei]